MRILFFFFFSFNYEYKGDKVKNCVVNGQLELKSKIKQENYFELAVSRICI